MVPHWLLGSSWENKYRDLKLTMSTNITHMTYKEPLLLYPRTVTFYLMMGKDNLLNPKFSVSPSTMNFIDGRLGEASNLILDV